jgi:hypothetical protein
VEDRVVALDDDRAEARLPPEVVCSIHCITLALLVAVIPRFAATSYTNWGQICGT